jgi:hypothetical protein
MSTYKVRRKLSSEFKAKVALEALKDEQFRRNSEEV